MNFNVTVTADDFGNVITQSANNPDYGYIRVLQVTNQISEGGWLKLVKRFALLKGTIDDLKAINYKAGDTIPGAILVRESFEPFNPVNPDKDLKIAGNSGVVCKSDERPIYRETYYTNNPYAIDEFINHDNSEEIKTALAAQQSLSTLFLNKQKAEL